MESTFYVFNVSYFSNTLYLLHFTKLIFHIELGGVVSDPLPQIIRKALKLQKLVKISESSNFQVE